MSVRVVDDLPKGKPGDLLRDGSIIPIGQYCFSHASGEVWVHEEDVKVYEAFGWERTDRTSENGFISVRR